MFNSRHEFHSPFWYAILLFGAVVMLSLTAAIGHLSEISMVGFCHLIQVTVPLIGGIRIFQDRNLSRERILIGIALLLLSAADGMFYILKYVFGLQSREPFVEVITTLPYPIVNILCIMALTKIGKAVIQEWGIKYSLGACTIAGILWVPIAYSVVTAESFSSMGTLQWILTMSQPVVTFLLTCLGAMLLVFVRSIHWNAFALGILSLALGDWAVQVENIFKFKASISLNTYIWTMASFAFCLPAIVSGLRSSPILFKSDSKSLVVNARLWLLIGISVPVSLFSVLWEGRWQMIAFVSLTILMIAIVVFISTNYFLNALERTEQALERGFNSVNFWDDTSKIPSELRNGIVSVYLRQIQIEKSKSEQEAEKAAATEILAKSVAHDLGGPLTALRVLSSFGGDTAEGELMRSAIAKIETIASDLLNRYRPKVTTSCEASISLARIIDSAIEFKKIEWSRSVQTKVGQVPSDAWIQSSLQMERILSNVIQNSYDALEDRDDGVIKVEFSDCVSHYEVAVHDNGNGIPQGLKEKIGLEGFTTKGPNKGNGIGLYSALNHLKAHGGDLVIHSIENVGTEVILKVPKGSLEEKQRAVNA